MAKTKGKKTAGTKKAPAGKGGPAKAPAEKAEKPKETAPKVSQAELDALRNPVEEAKGRLEKAQAEAKALAEKARAVVAEAKDAYRTALAPYREACHKAGATCEFEGGRSANVTEKVSFLVEKTDKGVRVCVKGRPETEEVIPLAALKESINRAAYTYTDKWVGPREEVGNKGGSLSNRLRAVLNA
jgi:Tfp pilus assembly protein FimV